MAKNPKKKQREADFKHRKAKVGRKLAPANSTKTEITSRAVTLPSQGVVTKKAGLGKASSSSSSSSSEPLSVRKHDVQELLVQLNHYNPTQRKASMQGLREIIVQADDDVFATALAGSISDIITRACHAVNDSDRGVRRASLALWGEMLPRLERRKVLPFAIPIVAHMNIALSSVDHGVRSAGLDLLERLVEDAPVVAASQSDKILPNFTFLLPVVTSAGIAKQGSSSKNRQTGGAGASIVPAGSRTLLPLKFRARVIEVLRKYLTLLPIGPEHRGNRSSTMAVTCSDPTSAAPVGVPRGYLRADTLRSLRTRADVVAAAASSPASECISMSSRVAAAVAGTDTTNSFASPSGGNPGGGAAGMTSLTKLVNVTHAAGLGAYVCDFFPALVDMWNECDPRDPMSLREHGGLMSEVCSVASVLLVSASPGIRDGHGGGSENVGTIAVARSLLDRLFWPVHSQFAALFPLREAALVGDGGLNAGNGKNDHKNQNNIGGQEDTLRHSLRKVNTSIALMMAALVRCFFAVVVAPSHDNDNPLAAARRAKNDSSNSNGKGGNNNGKPAALKNVTGMNVHVGMSHKAVLLMKGKIEEWVGKLVSFLEQDMGIEDPGKAGTAGGKVAKVGKKRPRKDGDSTLSSKKEKVVVDTSILAVLESLLPCVQGDPVSMSRVLGVFTICLEKAPARSVAARSAVSIATRLWSSGSVVDAGGDDPVDLLPLHRRWLRALPRHMFEFGGSNPDATLECISALLAFAREMKPGDAGRQGIFDAIEPAVAIFFCVKRGPFARARDDVQRAMLALLDRLSSVKLATVRAVAAACRDPRVPALTVDMCCEWVCHAHASRKIATEAALGFLAGIVFQDAPLPSDNARPRWVDVARYVTRSVRIRLERNAMPAHPLQMLVGNIEKIAASPRADLAASAFPFASACIGRTDASHKAENAVPKAVLSRAWSALSSALLKIEAAARGSGELASDAGTINLVLEFVVSHPSILSVTFDIPFTHQDATSSKVHDIVATGRWLLSSSHNNSELRSVLKSERSIFENVAERVIALAGEVDDAALLEYGQGMKAEITLALGSQ